MYFKILAFTLCAVSLVGCSEHDEEYYAGNLEAAQTKVKECEERTKQAFLEKDKDKLQSISEDKECIAADKIYRIHKSKLRKIEHEQQQERLKKEQEEKSKKFDAEYKKHITELETLPYTDFLVVQEQHCKRLTFEKVKPICKAFNELKPIKENEQINILKQKYKDKELEDYKDGVCKGLSFDKIQCSLSKQAVREQREEIKTYYLDNRDALKKDFNECSNRYSAFRKAGKHREATQSLKEYKCQMVGKAARELKVYSFKKPIS